VSASAAHQRQLSSARCLSRSYETFTSIIRRIAAGSRPAASAPSATLPSSSSYSAGSLPLVQMKPSPTRPASLAASGPDAAT
jgi:hypothetical protein